MYCYHNNLLPPKIIITKIQKDLEFPSCYKHVFVKFSQFSEKKLLEFLVKYRQIFSKASHCSTI